MKSIKFKLISISLLLLAIPSLIISLVSYENSKDSLEASGKMILKNSVESAIQLINELNEEVEHGELTLEEAQEKAKEILIGPKRSDGTREIVNPVDIGEYGYLYAIDMNGVQVASPSVEGQNNWENKDKNGKLFIQEKIKKAKSGGGFTTFYFVLPNNKDQVAEKISYSKLEPHWGWAVSAGAYKMDFNKPANELLNILAITLSLALIIGTIIALLFAKHLATPLTKLSKKVNDVAAGNLSVSLDELKRKDEIGSLNKSFNEMVLHLKNLIGNVENSITEIQATSLNLTAVAEETTASGDEIARAIDEVSRGSVQQASDADDTNQMTTKFANQIVVVHEKNNHMLESSQDMQLANEKGLENIQFLKEKSGQTSELINHVQRVIISLINKVKEIENIVGAINDISNQTNLLALNASIEAARAGEHGKGFAVVAEEVRKLAEQTSEATLKVRESLNGIETETHLVNEEMDKTLLIVNEQNQAVNSTESAFNHIESSVYNIITAISETASGVEALMDAKDLIAKSVESIAAISEETAASAEQVTSSVDEQQKAIQVVTQSATKLSDEINDLKQAIDKFVL